MRARGKQRPRVYGGTIKRHATGKGNANKEAMIAAAKARGFSPADDNEADAIAILIAIAPTLAAEVLRLREALTRIDRLTEEAPFDFGLIRLIARQSLDATSAK